MGTRACIFSSKDMEKVVTPHNDPLVLTVGLDRNVVARMLVDRAVVLKLFYKKCQQQMQFLQANLVKIWQSLHLMERAQLQVIG